MAGRTVPGQSLKEWVQDLESATQQDVDEITVYPSLITEHCLGYKLVEKGQINQPDRSAFKKMVYTTEDTVSSKFGKTKLLHKDFQRGG